MLPMMIAAIEDNDERIFMSELYCRFYGIMLCKANDIVQDMDAAEDVVQDAAVKLINRLQVIKSIPKCKLAAYVVMTARSAAIDYCNKSKNGRRHTYYSFDDENAPEPPDTRSLPEETEINLDIRERLRKAFDGLPAQERDILIFKYLLDMSDKEIAGIFRIKASSVRMYLTRARKHARILLAEGSNDDEQ